MEARPLSTLTHSSSSVIHHVEGVTIGAHAVKGQALELGRVGNCQDVCSAAILPGPTFDPEPPTHAPVVRSFILNYVSNGIVGPSSRGSSYESKRAVGGTLRGRRGTRAWAVPLPKAALLPPGAGCLAPGLART